MSDTLRRDIGGLWIPDTLLNKVLDINQDLLAHIQYICYYWISYFYDARHLLHDQIGFCNSKKVYIFLQNHFLHWLEALSLMENISDRVIIVKTLESMLRVSDSKNYTCFTN